MNECFHLEPESEINIVCPCFFGLLEIRSAIVSFFHLTPKLCHWKFFTAYIMRFRAFSMGTQCLLASVPVRTPQLLFKHSPVHWGGGHPTLCIIPSCVPLCVSPCVPLAFRPVFHGLFLRAPTIFSGFPAFRMGIVRSPCIQVCSRAYSRGFLVCSLVLSSSVPRRFLFFIRARGWGG